MLFFPGAFRQLAKPDEEMEKREFENKFPDYDESVGSLRDSAGRRVICYLRFQGYN